MGDAEAAAGALISALQVLTPTEGARTSQLTALASNVLAALEGGKVRIIPFVSIASWTKSDDGYLRRISTCCCFVGPDALVMAS